MKQSEIREADRIFIASMKARYTVERVGVNRKTSPISFNNFTKGLLFKENSNLIKISEVRLKLKKGVLVVFAKLGVREMRKERGGGIFGLLMRGYRVHPKMIQCFQ